MNGIIGRKLGMTRVFGADGLSTPVTVIEAGPCPVVGVRKREDVKVPGTTKGRGFQWVVHRHGFHGGPATHGNTRHRKPGSVSPGTDPSRIIKGKKMPGHMGAEQHTEMGLTVV